MKFITENDLRTMYQQTPFSKYPYQEGQRLTPGGRQFLLDRGVKIEEPPQQRVKRQPQEIAHLPKCSNDGDETALSKIDLEQRMKLALHTIGASFLQVGVDLLALDVLSAQEVFAMEQFLMKLINGEIINKMTELNLNNQSCTGLNSENFRLNAGSCFEINGFHAQTEKGREIVKLHYLRCLLQEQQPELPKRYQEGINYLINRLSQMICQALGGMICQRKQ